MKKMLLTTTALLTLASGASMAADLSRPPPAAPVYTKAPPMMPVFTWTGCYVGGNVGGVWAKSDVTWAPNPAGFPTSGPDLTTAGAGTITSTGLIGGGQVGCNYQAGMFVFGAEGDWNYTGISGTRSATSPTLGIPITETFKSNWLATARGRLGIASGMWMVYATGGGAWANTSYSDSATFAASNTVNAASSSGTQSGYVVGGGFEWAFAPQWSLKAEYLYVNLGSVSFTSANSNPGLFPLATIVHSHSLVEDIGRVGINYKLF